MISRRRFLGLSAAAAGLSVADPFGLFDSVAGAVPLPPVGGGGNIEHVVLVMLENRSFDHLLSWLPGADGRHDLTFRATDGNTYPNYPLAPDFQGCGYSDADHSWEGWLVENDNGALDGFLQRPGAFSDTPGVTAAAANTFPIGYYSNLNLDGTAKAQPDLPVLGALAQNYTVLDRYFSAIAAETFPNRFYQHSARTDRDHNTSTTSTLPAIWDQLSSTSGTAKPTGAYYFQDLPFLGLWGAKYLNFLRPYAAGQGPVPRLGTVHGTPFLDAVKGGTLPNVSFVDPSFVNEGAGTSGDDHPLADLRIGERTIADVYHALNDAGYLDSTVLVITFDEWGGFYDHVAPPVVADDTNPVNVDHTGNNRPVAFPGPNHPDYGQLGFRVPCIVVSNYATARVVSTGPFEHTSTLSMIESLFSLQPLTARDASANDLGTVLAATKRSDNPSSRIPTSSQVPGPASGAAAACGPRSVQSASPAARPSPALPESPLAVGLPVAAALAGGAVLAARHLSTRDPRTEAAGPSGS
ncbi:MAG: phospholipase [Actinomycetota bacterium]|nr:phospholipase [Actinomycetota bacterium]MDQ6945162.1 phospholipase [Actinomycetota bacterium]